MLTAHGLQCTISGRTLWRDLDVALAPGDRLAVRGPSGSGKTLLLRTLAALAPCDGALHLDGRPFSAWWPPAWRAQVLYLPQRAVLPPGTVEAALAMPFGFEVHRGRAFPRAWVEAQLEALHLAPGLLSQGTEGLSGGEAQLVSLVRALAVAPRVLLLDEATASVDPQRTGLAERLIDAWLAEAPDRACVWTSHDAQQLARVSDRALTLGGEA